MVENAALLRRWRLALVILAISHLAVSEPEVKIFTSSVKDLPTPKEEPVDKSKPPKKVSVIESAVKPDGPTKEPPINPMILPKNRQHLRFHHHHQDSYLNALEYSHTMALKELATTGGITPKPLRREYTLGPVYRGDDNNNNHYNGDDNKSNVPGKSEIQPKISRISTYNSPSYQQQPSVVISEPQSYNNYETYDTYSPPSFSQSQSFNGPPTNNYGPPTNTYGPPSPGNTYGPPSHNYGSPPPSQGEGKGLGSLQATYSTSYPLPDLFPLSFISPIDLSWPISLKLNAFTLIKIVLKIIVFKMIVKFIATICLLLFLPKIIQTDKPEKPSGDDDDSRKFYNKPSWENLRLIKTMVTKAVEHYETLNKNKKEPRKETEKAEEEEIKRRKEPCTTLGCKIRSKLFSNDTWDDYVRLFKSYAAEELQPEKEPEEDKVQN